MTRRVNGLAPFYRYFFLYFEPFSALVGAYYAYSQPQTYLSLTHAPTAPRNDIPTSTRIILIQLSNLYFLFAINEALVLRATNDLKVWRAVLTGLLIADIGHLWSVSPLGMRIYWDVRSWNAIDWGNIGVVYVGAITRICFLQLPSFTFSIFSKRSVTPRRSTRRTKPSSRLHD